MKKPNMRKFIATIAFACACSAGVQAQVVAPSTFRHITIDGSFNDWTNVPVAYTAPIGSSNAIQYQNIYLANDLANLYIRCTLYSPQTNAFANAYNNLFFDTDNNPATGYQIAGIGSSMLIQHGKGYQETNGGFNVGSITNLGWALASSADYTDFEMAISLNASNASTHTLVFTNYAIALLFEGEDTNHTDLENVPASGGLVYTFAVPLGSLVPAYFSPSSHAAYWNELDFAASLVPLIAVMNPSNGPGPAQNSSYTSALAQLHQAGGAVLGYVYSSYGARALADVETDISTYLSWYAVDGFFIDEMASDANTNHYNYYASIYQYIKSKGAAYSVTGNPGGNSQQNYLTQPTADALVVFESYGSNYVSYAASSWVTNYPPEHFVHIVHDTAGATTMSNYVGLAEGRDAGWVYITDSGLYSVMPSYWTNEVYKLQSLNAGPPFK